MTQFLMGEGEGGGDLWDYFTASGGLGGFQRWVYPKEVEFCGSGVFMG